LLLFTLFLKFIFDSKNFPRAREVFCYSAALDVLAVVCTGAVIALELDVAEGGVAVASVFWVVVATVEAAVV
jgi:hypothetical protein